jgi:hypothetical protein
MGGSVKFQDALAERLNLMACSQQQLDAFLAAHPAQLSPGVLGFTVHAFGAVFLIITQHLDKQ